MIQRVSRMEVARITSRGRVTIPKSIREAASLCEGDTIALKIEGDRLVLRKVVPGRGDYLHSLTEAMSEWLSPEDEEAWRDL